MADSVNGNDSNITIRRLLHWLLRGHTTPTVHSTFPIYSGLLGQMFSGPLLSGRSWFIFWFFVFRVSEPVSYHVGLGLNAGRMSHFCSKTSKPSSFRKRTWTQARRRWIARRIAETSSPTSCFDCHFLVAVGSVVVGGEREVNDRIAFWCLELTFWILASIKDMRDSTNQPAKDMPSGDSNDLPSREQLTSSITFQLQARGLLWQG